ncbi:MAG: DNA primase large subunit PriL [Candidatus Bathyarchaeota archaeon]|nr:MAG: DNA primase large subunit PriL [Candidatus Bathyarchaeota archaeon]
MISDREAAKYPFLNDAVTYVETLGLTLENLVDPSYTGVLERGERRVSQAILSGEATVELEDTLTELLSFPVANMFITAMAEEYLFRRYALSEAARAHELLKDEAEERIAKLARLEFGWDLRLVQERVGEKLYRFEAHFKDYLKNAASFREPEWKLVNRLIRNGYVLLTKRDASRLLQEEIQRRIGSLVSKRRRISLPDPLRIRVNNLQKLFDENRSRLTGQALPTKLLTEALPPCIRHAFQGLMAGRRASHMERFALTSFLINAGMGIDDIVKLFASITDFDEQFTRYQIEHIAGLRGSRTRYTPPTCSTLKTHRVCYEPDRLCERIKHPLSYYRIKVRDYQRE